MGVGQFLLLVALTGGVVLIVCFAYGRSLNTRILAAEQAAARARAEADAANQAAARARAEADAANQAAARARAEADAAKQDALRARAETAEQDPARAGADADAIPSAVLGDGPGVWVRLHAETSLHLVSVDVRVDRTAAPEGQLRVTVTTASRQTSGADADSLAKHVADDGAGKLVDRGWSRATRTWMVEDPGGFDAAAGRADAVGTALHDLLVGAPLARISRAAALPDPIADGIGDLAAGLVDGTIAAVSRSVRVVGVVVAAATGHPVLALAAVTSPAHDKITKWVADGLEDRTGLDHSEGPAPSG